MKLIDTHSHIYEPEFDADREEALARAVDAGDGRMLCPAIDSQSHGRLFDLCRRHHPDVVLMDIRMPVMDGLTATRKIRGLNREDAGTVPIMALTANASQEDSRYAASIGMNEYLTKPVEMKLLYRKIKEFFCR